MQLNSVSKLDYYHYYFYFCTSINIPFSFRAQAIIGEYMKSRIILIILTAAVLTSAALVYLFVYTPHQKISSEAIRAIPIDASIVVKTNNLGALSQALKSENDFWLAIDAFKMVGDVNKFFEMAQRLRKESPAFEETLFNNQLLMSVHVVGKGTPELFFATNIPEKYKPTDLSDLIDKETGSGYSKSVKEYNGVKIFSYNKNTSDIPDGFSITYYQGVAMYSKSLLLIESALGQLSAGISLLDSKSFIEANKTAGTNELANVFINHLNLPSLIEPQLHSSKKENIIQLKGIASWSEMDLSIKKDAFYLNGFSQVPDSLNLLYRIFADQKPVKMKVSEVLPAQTAALFFLGISDFNKYIKSFKKYLEGKGRINDYTSNLNDQQALLNTNVETLYRDIFGNQLALAFIPFEGEEYNDCWFVVSETKSKSQANETLVGVIQDYANKNGQSFSSFERSFSVDREKSVKIYKLPRRGLHESLFGNLFAVANDQYFTFIDSYVVFGSSVESLSRLILSNIHNKQLAVEQSFSEFSESLSIESNFTAYINPGKAEMLYGIILNPSSGAKVISRMETFNKIQGIAVQLTGGKNLIFNNICARYSPYSYDTPQTVWETRLDTAFVMKPQLVINHNNQDREIFVQDLKNNIYLINDVGRVLWKRPLPEKIMGEVEQVDIYRNGKLQLIFNTKSSLYLIDRNGNNVESFPVKLRSPATNPISVFDYDNNRNYRFFVAGEDRRIYVYDKSGNIVTGWDFDRSERIVDQPIQHFRENGRDYIVFSDQNRPYILDRQGNERVKPQRYFSKATNATFVLEERNRRSSARFVTSDSLGIVRFIYLDGKVEDKPLKNVGTNHFFDYQDVDADGRLDFILLDDNELTVFKNDGSELFSKKFKSDVIPQVIYFHFGGRDRKLGVVSAESSQIYLINSDGSSYKGFPLKGITPFSIGRFRNTKTTFNLMVGSAGGYVLNYAVQ